MHPKQIIKDFESMGAPLVLEGDDLFIDNPEKIADEIVWLVKCYKSRIITYLKGGYSDKEHAMRQTIDKIVDWQLGVEQDINSKINAWLLQDYESMDKIMHLLNEFYLNGWTEFNQPVANYETEETDKLSIEIFDRAMFFFKKGVVM
jgi:serine protease inhibitor